jgi:hypothetical protein
MGTCRNCGASSTIRAHLFPKVFCQRIGVDLDGNPEDFAHLDARSDRFQPTKTGLFDKGILCERCDQALGRLDSYAYNWTERTKREWVYPYRGPLPAVLKVEGEPRRLLLFALSILWRFAVSTRPEVGPLHTGPYAERIRKILFDAAPIELNIDCFMIAAKTTVQGAENQYRTPKPVRNDHLNGFAFYLNGFAYLVRLGAEKRPIFPGDPARRWWLRSADAMTLPLEPYTALTFAREQRKLLARGHPGFAFATREKARPR